MSNILGKIKNAMFGTYEDDDYYEDEYEETMEREPAPMGYGGLHEVSREDYAIPPQRKSSTKSNAQVYSINTQVQMQVVIIKPECYENAQEICDQIKMKKPVVVNLEKVEFPVAQRIMDFLSGTCYSLEGSIQRVANNIFIIAPENVDISGDLKEELKTKGVIFPRMAK